MSSFTLIFLIPSWFSDWRQRKKNNKEQGAIASHSAEKITDTFLKEDDYKTKRAIQLLYTVHGKNYVDSLSDSDFRELLSEAQKSLDEKAKQSL